ncbi:MAG: D-glycero-beta-D-manno-heptose 1-phosphate adenylyltransferase [Bacteroidetes bacterium]|jgi:rfaE bifunctional protein nucleotidyltransferase chain/domain|nr:D-glycero-beta-D-manno-heptose 1-phosphate adenylyltransferase [Bacteroidota bacterium]
MNELTKIVDGKIFSDLEDLKKRRHFWREQGRKVVFTNGCFDLLHLGHLSYLSEAKHLGEMLIVGLNSDSSVKKLKGPTRPLKSQKERSIQLAIMSIIDAVIIFEEETPALLIKSLQPDILVKGGDYTLNEVVGKDTVEEVGGRVVVLPFLEGYSTTQLINKIQDL